MRIQGVCQVWGQMRERLCVSKAALVWPACKATSSIIGSSSCSFRAGSLSCLGENAVERMGVGRGRGGGGGGD